MNGARNPSDQVPRSSRSSEGRHLMPTLPVLLPGQIIVGGSGDGSSSGLSGARTFGMSWQRVSWREVRND